MKRMKALGLAMVMVLGMSSMAFAGTITAPETAVEGEGFTVTLLGDNAAANNATVVWIVNGVAQEEVVAGKTTNADGKDVWTSTYTVTDPAVGEYTFDAVINKYKNDGDLQAKEDSDAVVTEVVAPVSAPVGYRVVEIDWNTPGKSNNSQLIIETIQLVDANGNVVDTVEWNYTIGGFKTQDIELLGARNLTYTTADGTVLTLQP